MFLKTRKIGIASTLIIIFKQSKDGEDFKDPPA